jgi:hypothetical protein
LPDTPSNFLSLYSKSFQLLHISKEKTDADSLFMVSYSCNLKREGFYILVLFQFLSFSLLIVVIFNFSVSSYMYPASKRIVKQQNRS